MNLLELLNLPDVYPLFVTGAGISLASGVPTFRGNDPDAVWANDILERGTLRYFQQNPVIAWDWFLQKFDTCRTAKPNPAHIALAEIETKLLSRGNKCLTVTQNVDGLHRAAGTQNLVEVHGSAWKMRCTNRHCVNGAPRGFLSWDDKVFTAFRTDPRMETLPQCPECGKLIRAHVLWFDEHYSGHEDYRIGEVYQATEEASLVIFVGTSFSVGITDLVLSAFLDSQKPTVVIDPHRTEPPEIPYSFSRNPGEATLLRVAAEDFLPVLAEEL